MEPRIQYAKTSDGVSIAYWAMGSGPPLVWMELPSHLQAERKLLPEQRSIYEDVSRIATLVRYDHRGFGLSERAVSAFPIDALVNDLEAVVDRVGLTTFILLAGGGFTPPVAISYAAAHSKRVSQLVLLHGVARIPPQLHQQVQALLLVGRDWRFISESFYRLALGWEDEERSRVFAALWQEAVTYETFRAFWRDAGRWDVRDQLPNVVMPTLLIHWVDSPLVGPEHSREIASLMPDARAAFLDASTSKERGAQSLAAVASFLFGPDAARTEPRTVAARQGTAVIVFADIVDSTALTERLGDAGFRAKARELGGALRAVIRECSGRPVEGPTLGDGVLAAFTSAREAIEAARRCAKAGDVAGLPLHLGIHAGDITREKDPDGRDNVYGGAVNIASRISGLSGPGEVLVSDTVRSLARTSAGVAFEDRGKRRLKGVAEPVRVWAVQYGNQASTG